MDALTVQYFEKLGRELSCTICLGLATAPLARLANCGHRFCLTCIQSSLSHAQQCPLCRAPASRRDIARDERFNHVLGMYNQLALHAGEMLPGTQRPPEAPLQPEPHASSRQSSKSRSGSGRSRLELKPPVTASTPEASAPSADASDSAREKRQKEEQGGMAAAELPGPHQAAKQAKWAARTGWVLSGSCLEPGEEELMKEVAAASSSRVAKQWEDEVTHVICHLDSNQAAKRTLKLLTGVVHGIWVVGVAWLQQCQDLAGPVAEDAFEVLRDTRNFEGAAMVGRLERAEGQHLLAGFQVHASDDIKASIRKQLEDLIRLSGAQLLKRPPSKTSAAGSSSPGRVIVLHEDDKQKGRKTPSDKRRHSSQCLQHLSYRWLIESAGTFNVQDIEEYRI
ncbi:hypothetical protein WJX73_007872 [Symbiochloris irregularis]|uniref:RING-type E3 ubiquitin transferase BRCA1 n=1 Tax=Symbiochloris irregularis TaxID=706552 RepID=A0AAW1NNY5_9CHLO